MSFELTTERLVMRLICEDDIPHFVPLLNDYDVVKNLGPVPHPYTEQLGREFVASTTARRAKNEALNLAVCLKDGTFIGFCTANASDEGVTLEKGARELGYWYGKPFWGQGFATEAGRRMVSFAFDSLNVNALFAGWFFDNPASGRVLLKLGFNPGAQVQRWCVSRGTMVASNRVFLTRSDYLRKRASCDTTSGI